MKRTITSIIAVMCLASLLGALGVVHAQDGAIRDNPGFTTMSRPPNDNGFDGPIGIGFPINFFGRMYTTLFVNNNGNVTPDQGLSAYSPDPLQRVGRRIFAPFWADVDTRGEGSDVARYGPDRVDGHAAFGVNWINVGYYNQHADKLNQFQLVLIDRGELGPGDFDFEFNYDQIQWETGDASGGREGLGGDSDRAGYSDGTPEHTLELPGSGINGAHLDSNPTTGLIYNGRLSDLPGGRYLFQVRSGQAQAVPIPTGEITASDGWADSDTCAGAPVNPCPTQHKWKQTLTPGSTIFMGRTVTERDPGGGVDLCHFPGSMFRPATAITGGTWTVDENNMWGDDYVGWTPSAVTYYREQGQAPCRAAFPQKMVMATNTGEATYIINNLSLDIGETTVSSGRAGQSQTRDWP
jgi:hypothetical protein